MYPIIDVTADAGHLEPMGSKPKFWFDHPEWGKCLFKAARLGSGEDWSEKLAEQLAAWLGLPHARYELASWKGQRGIVTPRITTEAERLVHGNELLIELDPDYDAGSADYRTPLHTVSAVIGALDQHAVALPKGWTPPDGINGCVDVFAGYLLLDALIGNTDRHHENWAAVESPEEGGENRLFLAPTFDHASSLARNEPVARIVERLNTKDRGFSVEAYAGRARSAFYSDPADARPLTPLDAFGEALSRAPKGARVWCRRLRTLDRGTISSLIESVPAERMAEKAREFVTRMISHNRDRLLTTCEGV
jgi:hypothetical protein